MKQVALAAALSIVACARVDAGSPRPDDGVHAIWVTRFEYQTEAEIKAILQNCSGLGFNTVLFQVRGQADAYYRSRIEPWSERLGGKDPGFDPLEVACREAHRLGLSLHAWVNAMPAWRGKTPPVDRNHVCYRHPDWMVVGRDGRRQAFNDHYLCLNPCLPAVREHVTSVMKDIATRYPVDGLHLDYIRFIEGEWSYDEKTLNTFGFIYGGSPDEKPAEWAAFRRSCVTDLVRSIREAVKLARPEAVVSAAVFPTAESRRKVLQDAEGWVRAGLVEWVFPMTYSDSDGDFRSEIEEGYSLFRQGGVSASNGTPLRLRNGRAVDTSTSAKVLCFPGVGAYKHKTADQTVRQLEMCPAGFALFSYSSLFVSPDETRKENEKLCKARREAVRRFLAR
jgi:uncharacterized lipoprotein YddW (UPF0748 family)